MAASSWGPIALRSDPIHELGAEFAADPPGKAALARPAGGQDDGELRRNLRIVGDHLDAAVRDVRDHAVTRQCAGSKLNFCDPVADNTLALPPIIDEHFPVPPRW